MKLALFALISFCAGAAEIPKGTHVLLRMLNSISTRTAAEGTQVYLQTVTPVAINGEIVLPPGTYVQGSVSHAKRSGRVKGRAELGIHTSAAFRMRDRTLHVGAGRKHDFAVNRYRRNGLQI